MILCRAGKLGRQRRVGRGHFAIFLGKFGSLADRPLDRVRSLGAVEARTTLRQRRCTGAESKKARQYNELSHVRLHALSRRTASSISAVDPANDMRNVPAPRARSKSTPGVIATPASRNIRL